MKSAYQLNGIRFAVVACILAFAWSPALRAQTELGSASNVQGLSGLGYRGVLCSQSSTLNPTASSSCSANYSVANGITTGSGTAQAAASYGILQGYSTASSQALSSAGYAAFVAGVSNAMFIDELTFTGLSQPATLVGTLSLAGTLTSSGYGSATATLGTYFGGQPECTLQLTGSCTISISVSDSSNVEFYAFLATDSVVDSGNVAGSGGATASFFDTGIVNSLLLVDSNGNPISGADVISASGTNYNDLSEAPEPSSFLLVGTGLLGLIYVAKRQSRRGMVHL